MKEEARIYDAEITMIQGGGGFDAKPIRKQKMMNINFNHDDLVPFDHQGTEPLMTIVVVGRTLTQRIYIDNGSFVNIIYEHFLKGLYTEIQKYSRPTTSTVVGFAGQSVYTMGKIPLPFTVEDYRGRIWKIILTQFLIIRAPSPYNMLLGRTGLWTL